MITLFKLTTDKVMLDGNIKIMRRVSLKSNRVFMEVDQMQMMILFLNLIILINTKKLLINYFNKIFKEERSYMLLKKE